jgi:purine-nucleoside phosphorylase
MSLHLAAAPGQIASRILLPGDPLRAQWIAENYLQDAECYSRTRNMLGFTGTYKGERVSVQGTGMGAPSISIYVQELFQDYDVQVAIRVGTCGSIQPHIKLRDVLLAQAASSDSGMNRRALGGLDFAPIADFGLLKRAHDVAEARGSSVVVGGVGSMDVFYDTSDSIEKLSAHGVMALEMEASALYTLAARFGRRALAVLSVTDIVGSHEALSQADRETSLREMVEIALDTAITS